MQEEWRDVPGYEGLYQVSNLGFVRNIKFKRTNLLKPRLANGYKRVALYSDKIPKDWTVHRLVANAFIPNPENKPYIDHIDGNKTNNFVSNLRWCTQKENCNFPIAKKRRSGFFGVLARNVKPIVCVEIGKFFWGAYEAERELHINQANITKVAKGKKETAGGYHWRYATPEEIEQNKMKG